MPFVHGRLIPQAVWDEALALLRAAAKDQPCDCPHDYPGDGHNYWCPASMFYLPRTHAHDASCYAGEGYNGPRICGKIAGLSLETGVPKHP